MSPKMTLKKIEDEILGSGDRLLEESSALDTTQPVISHEISDGHRPVRVLDNGAFQEIGDPPEISKDPFPNDFDVMREMYARAKAGPDGEVLEEIDALTNYRSMQEDSTDTGLESPTPSGVTDDFQEHLEAREEAHIISGGDELGAIAHLRTRQRVAENEAVPARSINPASWDRGLLGGTATFDPTVLQTTDNTTGSAKGGEVIQVVHWPGDDRETIPITVTFQPYSLPSFGASTKIMRPFARIQWGTRNTQFQADVDIGVGEAITLAASSCYVSLGMDSGSNLAYTLGAAISFYATSRPVQATRTMYLTMDNSGGADSTFIRPQFSTSILGFDRADPTTQWVLKFKDFANTLIYERLIAPNTYLTSPIYLSNDVAFLSVNVSGGSGSDTTRIIWGLF